MKDHLSKYLHEFINGKPTYEAANESLLQEMREWGTVQSDAFTGHKALRVYVKALVRKKIALAQRIKDKYVHLFPKPDDTTIALGFALMASKRHQTK